MKIVIYGFAIAYLALLLLVFFAQRKLLYLPDTRQPDEALVASEGLQFWPSVDDYRGFVGRHESVEVIGTIVVFHGNAGAAYSRGFYVDALGRLGLRVILAEYPGYGGREGRPAERILVEDALATLRLAHHHYPGPLFVWGESLGSGVAAHAIAETDVPIQGAVLGLPWDTLPDLAQAHYWYLPARYLARERYDNIDNLRGFDGRVAVILAGADEVVPVCHGRRLYDSITADKALWLFEDATHNTVPVAPDLPWWREVVEFISRGDNDPSLGPESLATGANQHPGHSC